MRAITQYQTDDGTIFRTVEAAAEHEALAATVADALAPLGRLPKLPGCSFANGAGYVWHSPETVRGVKARLVEIGRPFLGDPYERAEAKGTSPMDLHPSWFGRMLDGTKRPLEDAWQRLCCIDDMGREWGQPYFALNPEKAEQTMIEDRRRA